jgi:hypothetical protein
MLKNGSDKCLEYAVVIGAHGHAFQYRIAFCVKKRAASAGLLPPEIHGSALSVYPKAFVIFV